MEAFYLYILQVNIGILAFYLLYRFLLAHDTFLEMRRAYWWLVWATVFAYPWVELHAVRGEAMPLQVVMADYVETITLVASAVAPVEAPSWTWQDALAGVWALGAAVLVVRFLVQLAVCAIGSRLPPGVARAQTRLARAAGHSPRQRGTALFLLRLDIRQPGALFGGGTGGNHGARSNACPPTPLLGCGCL